MPGASRVVLYGRPACHLCDDVEPAIRAMARDAGARFERVDIDEDDDSVRRYGLEIPVVAIDDVDVARAPIDLRDVRAALRGPARDA